MPMIEMQIRAKLFMLGTTVSERTKQMQRRFLLTKIAQVTHFHMFDFDKDEMHSALRALSRRPVRIKLLTFSPNIFT